MLPPPPTATPRLPLHSPAITAFTGKKDSYASLRYPLVVPYYGSRIRFEGDSKPMASSVVDVHLRSVSRDCELATFSIVSVYIRPLSLFHVKKRFLCFLSLPAVRGLLQIRHLFCSSLSKLMLQCALYLQRQTRILFPIFLGYCKP
jgi:hypothetical protein